MVFDKFTPNPLYEDAAAGVKLFKEQGCDAIFAVGGGSSIDVAKCIKLYSGMDESIIPKYAILDYRNLITLPVYQKKCTVMDALCQSIESWWSINATEESRVYSRKALEMIKEKLGAYLANEESGNRNMMAAANLAGQAINITQTTAAHAMSYKLTSLYRVPHGRAAFMCLPYIWKYMREKNVLPDVFAEIAAVLGYESVDAAVEYLHDLDTKLFAEYPVEMNEANLKTRICLLLLSE